MAFFERKDIGRIYVIRIELPDDTIVHKIGITRSDRTVDRMMEILRSWFIRFRFVPYSELRLDMKTFYPTEIEKHIHRMLRHKRFIPHMKVSGGSEMFVDIDEDRVLHYIRTFDDELAPKLKLKKEDYEVLGKWLSP